MAGGSRTAGQVGYVAERAGQEKAGLRSREWLYYEISGTGQPAVYIHPCLESLTRCAYVRLCLSYERIRDACCD